MFVEVALGLLQNRGRVVNTALLSELAKNQTNEMYQSYYEFDAELIEHFKIRKTIRGYKGKYYLSNPLVDIDKGTDSDAGVLDRVRYFLQRLDDDFSINPDICRIFFSGRGYHIILPDIFTFQPSNKLPQIVKNTMEKYFPEGDNIYDGARLIRTVNSLNQKAGLYKIPLLAEEVYKLPAIEIHKLAVTRRTIEYPSITDYKVPELSALVELTDIDSSVNEAAELTNIITCVQKMYNEGAIEGTRHEKILRMATSWRRAGVPKEGIIAMIKDWSPTMEPYEIRRTVNDIFEKGYHPYKCSDKVMTKFCDQKCIFYKNKNYTTEVITSKDAEKSFAQYINSNLEERSFDLNEIFHCASYKFYPGEAIALIGDTKLGKSTLLQNICVALSDKKILYLSLENAQHLAYRRFIQMSHNMTKEQVEEYYRTNTNKLSEKISHIHTVIVPPTVQELKRLVIEHKPDIVVVDTIDGIDVPNVYDDTAKTYILGNELKNMATQLEVIIFAVAHISKASAIDSTGKSKALNIHSAKGASVIEQKFDKILAWEGDRNGVQRILTSLGARDEGGIKLSFNFNYVLFKMEQIGVKLHG